MHGCNTCSGSCDYTPVNTAKLIQPTLSLQCTYTFGTLQVHSSSIWVSTALATFACKRKPLTVYFLYENACKAAYPCTSEWSE